MAEAAATGPEGAEQQFDTVILGGEVIDPGSGVIGRYDVGIREGRIAAVEPSLASARAERVIDEIGRAHV